MLESKFVRPILLLVFFNFIVGCNKKKEVEPIYSSIELAYNSGWTYAFTLKIDSSNIVRKCDYRVIRSSDSTICYIDTLSYETLDSLNYFVKKLNTVTTDSLYDEMCQDCNWYIISVNQGDKYIKSEVIGDKHRNMLIDSLAQFIIRRSFGMKHKVDTTYYSEFKDDIIPQLPPPPIEY